MESKPNVSSARLTLLFRRRGSSVFTDECSFGTATLPIEMRSLAVIPCFVGIWGVLGVSCCDPTSPNNTIPLAGSAYPNQGDILSSCITISPARNARWVGEMHMSLVQISPVPVTKGQLTNAYLGQDDIRRGSLDEKIELSADGSVFPSYVTEAPPSVRTPPEAPVGDPSMPKLDFKDDTLMKILDQGSSSGSHRWTYVSRKERSKSGGSMYWKPVGNKLNAPQSPQARVDVSVASINTKHSGALSVHIDGACELQKLLHVVEPLPSPRCGLVRVTHYSIGAWSACEAEAQNAYCLRSTRKSHILYEGQRAIQKRQDSETEAANSLYEFHDAFRNRLILDPPNHSDATCDRTQADLLQVQPTVCPVCEDIEPLEVKSADMHRWPYEEFSVKGGTLKESPPEGLKWPPDDDEKVTIRIRKQSISCAKSFFIKSLYQTQSANLFPTTSSHEMPVNKIFPAEEERRIWQAGICKMLPSSPNHGSITAAKDVPIGRLCIIQYFVEDWAHEAALMYAMYSGATLTLSGRWEQLSYRRHSSGFVTLDGHIVRGLRLSIMQGIYEGGDVKEMCFLRLAETYDIFIEFAPDDPPSLPQRWGSDLTEVLMSWKISGERGIAEVSEERTPSFSFPQSRGIEQGPLTPRPDSRKINPTGNRRHRERRLFCTTGDAINDDSKSEPSTISKAHHYDTASGGAYQALNADVGPFYGSDAKTTLFTRGYSTLIKVRKVGYRAANVYQINIFSAIRRWKILRKGGTFHKSACRKQLSLFNFSVAAISASLAPNHSKHCKSPEFYHETCIFLRWAVQK
ncbi:uncharacterized protein CLUP02_11770 [Colletotrichum lupini]|uniref:Uncharacterized protein n=1 Tax=Colletotrichum lupini TaxID=145971 RepID=A0A9Q8WKR8_9PEZI|nr:uncharacterized protein CLUP02_11770 [Colletotrichum lupini]UQC86270.1 hypothetical protein CLUP02_11770 [Colletotrichum lupini]